MAECPIKKGGGGGVSSDELTATANKVLKGYSYVGADTDDEAGEGDVDVQSILSFSAAPYSTSQVTFTWKNPAKGAFSGVIIVGKTGSYPTNISDGTRWYKGTGNNTSANGTSTQVVSGFTQGTTYYFRAFAYAVKDGAEWIGESLTATATTKPKGTKTFTSSGTFTVPANVTSIDVFCVGGGGSGGKSNAYERGGGGGSGYTATKKGISVTPGATYAVTIGAGGAGGYYTNDGNSTSFGSLVTAKGGESGSDEPGGDGGSGGGTSVYNYGANGGSNGSDGYGYKESTTDIDRGIGQGTTTRAFGESSGTLYAGGGGGGGYNNNGAGGSGGGGRGGWTRTAGANPPTAGTANTGGGGGGHAHSTSVGGAHCVAGGSGICIIRWGY